jgi:accessory gene regulator protein AgrB
MVLETMKKMIFFFFFFWESLILFCIVNIISPELLVIFIFSPAEVEVRPKRGSEITKKKKKKKKRAEIMPTFVMRLEYVMSGLDSGRFSQQQQI